MLTYDNIFNNVLEKVPSFAPIYDEHIKDNDELLHHVLMGDITRYAIRLYREGRKKRDSRSHETLDTILQLLEEAIQSPDANLQELVALSFVENLGQADDDYDGIRALLKPALLKRLRAFESWRPNPPAVH
jgi:hypothetical protein